jgi:23S rRNA pseudouridine2605 synthase
VKRIRDVGKYSHIEVRITEGRNRQVRRMIEAIDSKVMKLVRTGIGPIQIGDLKIGTFRELTEREIESLSASPTRSGTSGRAKGSRAHGK